MNLPKQAQVVTVADPYSVGDSHLPGQPLAEMILEGQTSTLNISSTDYGRFTETNTSASEI